MILLKQLIPVTRSREKVNEGDYSEDNILKPFKGPYVNIGGVEVGLSAKNLSKDKALINKAEHSLYINGYRDFSNIVAVEIFSIDTFKSQQRQGLGTAAMTKIINIAEEEGIVLYLEALPIGDKRMSTRELVNWYTKLGFELLTYGQYPQMIKIPKRRI